MNSGFKKAPLPMPSVSTSDLERYASTLVLLAMLIAVDGLFIAMHALHAWSPLLNAGHYAIDADGGMAELYQYIKFLWLLGCLSLAFMQSRLKVYLAWIALFAVLLLDDAAQLHESVGTTLAQLFDFRPALGLRAKDFGEIAFAAAMGCFAVLLVAFTFWRGSQTSRHISADLLCLLCALAFFGVFFDAVHTIAYFKAPALVAALTLIEDGGEMLVVSAITAYAFDVASHAGQLRIRIWRWANAHLNPLSTAKT